MSDEKVLTEDVNAHGWLVRPGMTMFSMQNKNVSMNIQPLMQNFGICSISEDDDDIGEDYVNSNVDLVHENLVSSITADGYSL